MCRLSILRLTLMLGLGVVLAACEGQAPSPSATRPPASTGSPAMPTGAAPTATAQAEPTGQRQPFPTMDFGPATPTATIPAQPPIAAGLVTPTRIAMRYPPDRDGPLPPQPFERATPAPAFPDQAISAETIARLRPFRTVGFGGALHAVLSPHSDRLAVATTAGVAWFAYPSLQHLRFDQVDGAIYALEFSAYADILRVFLDKPGALSLTMVELRVADGALLDEYSVSYDPQPQIIASPSGLLEARLNPLDSTLNPGVAIVRLSDAQTIYQDEETLTVSFSDELRIVMVAYDGTVRVLDFVDNTTKQLLVPVYWAAGFSPDGQTLVTSGHHVQLWNVLDASLQHTLSRPNGAENTAALAAAQRVRYDASGSVLSVDGEYGRFEGAWRRGTAWEVESGRVGERLWDASAQGPYMETFATYVGAFSPASNHVAYTSDGTTLWIYQGDQLQQTLQVAARVSALEFSSDGALLAIGDKAGRIQLHRVADGSQAHSFSLQQGVYGIAFSPDGTLLGAKDTGGAITIWRLGQDSPLVRITDQPEEYAHGLYLQADIVFSADNQLLIVAGGESVRLYQLSDGRLIGSLPVDARRVAIGPFRRALAITLPDGRVQLWGVG